MPRFYFDVREGARFISDETGREFSDLDEAEREAVSTAAAIGRERLPDNNTADNNTDYIIVEIRNEHHQRVSTLTVSVNVLRADLPPDAPENPT